MSGLDRRRALEGLEDLGNEGTSALPSAGAIAGAGYARTPDDPRAAEAGAAAWLAAIVTSSRDAVISKDLNGVIRSWNRGAELMFGYTAAEAIGQPVTMLMPPECLAGEPRILEALRKGETLENWETVRRRKDGTSFDALLTIAPIIDARGKIIGASEIARDVSLRKRAEAALKEATAREREAREDAEILVESALLLAGEREFDKLVQQMTDLATKLIGAEYGSFFYNVVDEKGESYMLYTLSGANKADFAHMPMPRNAKLFQPTFAGKHVVREPAEIDDAIFEVLAGGQYLSASLRCERAR